MRKILVAALLVLHFSPGAAEETEELGISDFLLNYAVGLSDYFYGTPEYYSDYNTTWVPTIMYTYEYQEDFEDAQEKKSTPRPQQWEESEKLEESVGSSLQCHLPLIILFSLLGFLL